MLGYGVNPALRRIMYVRAGTDASSAFSCMGFYGQMMLRNTAASICSRIVLRCVPSGARADLICVIDRPPISDVGFCGGEHCGDSEIRSASVELREELWGHKPVEFVVKPAYGVDFCNMTYNVANLKSRQV